MSETTLAVPLPSGVPATVVRVENAAIVHLCPFRPEVDRGHISVEWIAQTATFELHELGTYLASFAEEKVSHEQLTSRIFDHLSRHPGVIVLGVRTRWQTAGMDVTVQIP